LQRQLIEGGSARAMRCGRCGLENPTGMRFCGGCGDPLGDEVVAVSALGGHDTAQRRHMTVMFCDLVGSTPLAESLDAEDFREVLTAYQQMCVRAIDRFDGYTAMYVGDGVVAYFGYPRAHEDDAQRAVHAGLGILDGLVSLNAHLREVLNISLEVRIGLHTGVVIAGETGAGETRSQLDIVGEMPHIAARLESIAPPGSVVISDATRDLVEGYFETEALGDQALKGLSRPIGVHLVLRPTGAAGRLEVAGARRLTPVVGRDDELARLVAAWQGVESGRGAIAQVTGEAGIGKSRLVHSLIEGLGRRIGAEQMWQCSAHHRSTALYPVIRFLERLFDLDRKEPAGRQLKVLHQAVDDGGLDPVEAVPLLADLLSVPGGRDDDEENLTPRDARTALFRILEALLVTNPARHPLLLVVEDLHWADPTTLELLGRITTNLPDIPVLCVLTFRGGFEPPWTQRQPVLEIELGPLRSKAVRAMATAASDTPLDAEVLEWVDSAADGVPLFVEEMLKMLAQGGGSEMVGHALTATAVPPTLEGLLTERLDRLPELGDVIDTAAILGREFERSLLDALEPLGGADLDTALVQLAAQDVLRPVGGARSRFEFTHALLQEAAYERILRRRRHALHGRVADTLIRRFAEMAEREPEVVAHHWSCAAEPAKAMPVWRAAGTRALERAAYLEAAEHFRRGLEALEEAGRHPGDDLEHVDFLTHLAASLQAGHGYAASGVDDAYARARTACERARNDDRLVSVIRGQWMFHLLRGEYRTALELAEEMLALGERGDHAVRLAEGHLYRGLVDMYLAKFDLAREDLDEAFTGYLQPDRSDHIYEAQGDTGVGALAYLALVLWNLGHAEESRRRSDLSLERAERVGGPVTRAQAWGMRSMLHLGRNEPAELGHWVERTLGHSVDHDLGYWRTVSALLSGWLEGRAGELELGTTRVEESLDAYLGSGSRLGLPHFHILLADLRLAAGDQRRALDVLRVGEEYIEETGERFSESELFRFKGRVLMAGESPDPYGATVAYETAVAAAREQNAKLLELRAATRLVAHQRRIGETCTAVDEVVALCDWFDSKSLPDVVRARTLVASEPMAR
jgi:class 3 adenylate cyclase/predicted ATPase